MDAAKKEIRTACKEANSYKAWRNPVGTWFVTLYDKEGLSIGEFQYSDNFLSKEKAWVYNLLDEIDKRRENKVDDK